MRWRKNFPGLLRDGFPPFQPGEITPETYLDTCLVVQPNCAATTLGLFPASSIARISSIWSAVNRQTPNGRRAFQNALMDSASSAVK